MLDLETIKGDQAARNGAYVRTDSKSTSSSLPNGVGLAGTIASKNGQGSDWEQRWPLPGRAPMGADGKPIRKAHSLIDKVYSWKNLMAAWRAVRRNKGAHGLDRVTIQEFERNLEQNLSEIQRKLQQDRFCPHPVRRVYIPKDWRGKKLRPLGIPIVADRVVQQALLQVLNPIFDPTFSAVSFGFRKGRRAHDAVTRTLEYKKQGYKHVVDADIQSFFDQIDHRVVMSLVSRRVADGRVLRLIESFLKAGIFEDGIVRVPAEGTPQGGVFSPLLANVVLDYLDKSLESKGLCFVRYADDFLVFVRTAQEAEQALTVVQEIIQELGLNLSAEKTKVTRFSEGFDFLGFHITSCSVSVSHKSLEKFRGTVRHVTRRNRGDSLQQVIDDLQPRMRGWINYFGRGTIIWLCHSLDGWIRMRLRAFKSKRKRHTDNHRIKNKYFFRRGLTPLTEMFPSERFDIY